MSIGEYIALAGFAFVILSASFATLFKVWQASADSRETKQEFKTISTNVVELKQHVAVSDERHRQLIERLDERQEAHEMICTEYKKQMHDDLGILHEKINRLMR